MTPLRPNPSLSFLLLLSASEILVLIKMLMLRFLCLGGLKVFLLLTPSLLKMFLYPKLPATYGRGSFQLLSIFHCFQVFSHPASWLPVLQTPASYRPFFKGTTCSFLPSLPQQTSSLWEVQEGQARKAATETGP